MSSEVSRCWLRNVSVVAAVPVGLLDTACAKPSAYKAPVSKFRDAATALSRQLFEDNTEQFLSAAARLKGRER